MTPTTEKLPQRFGVPERMATYEEGKRRGRIDRQLGIRLSVAYHGTAPQNQDYYAGYRTGWHEEQIP